MSYGNGIDMVVRGEVQQHWPMYLPYSGRNRYDNNAMARVESNGMRGFAVMEWATTMEESDTRVLDSLNP